MKRTATLVAGLLLVTGTVFAETSTAVTGELVYKNNVFETDKAVLQNVGDDDTQALKATITAAFNAQNKLELTLDEGNDPTVKLGYTYTGTETVFTATTKADQADDDGDKRGLFQKTDLKATHTKGNVKVQVSGTVTADLYRDYAHPTNEPTGVANWAVNTDADENFIEYKVTPKVTTTFYPYNTTFGIDSAFINDGETNDEFEGIKLKGFNTAAVGSYYDALEKVQDAPGIKVALTDGALKGLEVKFGTHKQQDYKDATVNTDTTESATYLLDVKYAREVVKGVTVKADFAMSTDEADKGTKTTGDAANTEVRNSKQALLLGASAKIASVSVEGEFVNVAGNTSASDFTGIYAKASTKVAAIDLMAKLATKKFGEADTLTNVYGEAKYTAKAINGVEPSITGSYKTQQWYENEAYAKDAKVITKNTLEVVVDAKIVKDALTVTPALTVTKVTDADTSTKGSIAVKYSF